MLLLFFETLGLLFIFIVHIVLYHTAKLRSSLSLKSNHIKSNAPNSEQLHNINNNYYYYCNREKQGEVIIIHSRTIKQTYLSLPHHQALSPTNSSFHFYVIFAAYSLLSPFFPTFSWCMICECS